MTDQRGFCHRVLGRVRPSAVRDRPFDPSARSRRGGKVAHSRAEASQEERNRLSDAPGAADGLGDHSEGLRVRVNPAITCEMGDLFRFLPLLRDLSREAADDFAVLSFGESLESLSGHIAQCAN